MKNKSYYNYEFYEESPITIGKGNKTVTKSYWKRGRKYKHTTDYVGRSVVSETTTRGANIFGLIVLILLVFAGIAILRYGAGADILTFESLLEFLQNVPTVDYGWLNIQDVSIAFPGWLSWLNDLINFFASLVEFLGFILAGAWQALSFVLYFLRYLFVG